MAIVKTVKYSEFLNTVGFVNAPVFIEQQGKDGYTVKAVYMKDEEENILHMGESINTDDSPKVFKSLATLEKVFRDAGIFGFTVSIQKEAITSVTRPSYTKEEKEMREAEKKKKELEAVNKRIAELNEKKKALAK